MVDEVVEEADEGWLVDAGLQVHHVRDGLMVDNTIELLSDIIDLVQSLQYTGLFLFRVN